ncbi:hypothetical protein [Brevundimonas variabilis]|uniref:Phosphoglycerol transferase MdoB-like AlkP superfamily enzyme n=1 Tax=Brevundimonas variabilis TaxID=74312 RepID=A0A7W9FF42_9CAUL|nr:hypothetical protein [Brevundimonas variabilis]MBB5745183.1 phosphoglycerol transferase MdoB-like AlkP superfamily enzyme [Brevundimonas variabilis]
MLVPITIQLSRGNFGWSLADFIIIAAILFAGCLLFDFAARRSPNLEYLLAVSAALAASFGVFVVNGAVGLVGTEDEAHNLFFLLVILVAIIGSYSARLRPKQMAWAMSAAALAHIVTSVAILASARGVSDGNPVMEVVGLAIFGGVWLASAMLFRQSARA